MQALFSSLMHNAACTRKQSLHHTFTLIVYCINFIICFSILVKLLVNQHPGLKLQHEDKITLVTEESL